MSLMIQGTNSNAGKSLLVAGLCRYYSQLGLKVRPFKPQNMSNNAAVAIDGGEIGRAQALQARACRVPPSVHMNPVLLKPESDLGAQVIVQGKIWGTLAARDYGRQKAELLSKVLQSYSLLSTEADLVIVEGAGSPAEVNLRAGDIANMGFATASGVPVLLAGDIDRGGVIASLVGTHAVLDEQDINQIKGFIINKFRGNIDLFDEGNSLIERRTGWPSLGVVPWFADAAKLPAEDALDLRGSADPGAAVKIAVPLLARIANFDDFDPLILSPDVSLDLVEPGRALPGDANLIILPGSKSTIGDLAFLRKQGWDVDIAAHIRRGGQVLGLCGGYQMMGRSIADPQGIEGAPGRVDGLGLLDVTTALTGDKSVKEVSGIHLRTGAAVSGYEIHLGRTNGPDRSRPWLDIEGQPEGAVSEDGRCAGAYVHGIFASDGFREAFLDAIRLRGYGELAYEPLIDKTLDALADHLAAHIDMDRLLEIARSKT